MEGVGDRPFRKAMASIGGFDEAVRDFIRVPIGAHVKSLAAVYRADEIAPIRLVPQIMGSDKEGMGEMARELVRLGAHRIDVNCGCPSNTVTGKGAGSSLLKDPTQLYDLLRSVVRAVDVPVSMKMRSGYEDTSKLKENLLAAQESGVQFLVLHPRTKVDGYGPAARWELIAEAKALLRIPVVGNGDITSVATAFKMLEMTGCDGLMIGRGGVMVPFLFQQIRAHFLGEDYQTDPTALVKFFEIYLKELPETMQVRVRVNKVKQILNFMFQSTPERALKRKEIMTFQASDPQKLLDLALDFIVQKEYTQSA